MFHFFKNRPSLSARFGHLAFDHTVELKQVGIFGWTLTIDGHMVLARDKSGNLKNTFATLSDALQGGIAYLEAERRN